MVYQQSDGNGFFISVIGTRAFAVAAATVWNRLPADIRTSTCTVQTFAQKLKTFYASRRI